MVGNGFGKLHAHNIIAPPERIHGFHDCFIDVAENRVSAIGCGEYVTKKPNLQTFKKQKITPFNFPVSF